MKHFCRTQELALLIFFAPLWLHAFKRNHQAHTHGEGALTLVM